MTYWILWCADYPLRSYVDDNGDVTLCSLINLDISHGKLEECLDALQEKAESPAVGWSSVHTSSSLRICCGRQ